MISDRILTTDQSLFHYGGGVVGRKKRQIEGPEFECTSFENCGDHSFEGLTLDDLVITDEQRAFCKNDESCLYDLAITGEDELAMATLEASENSTRLQKLISEKNMCNTVSKSYS